MVAGGNWVEVFFDHSVKYLGNPVRRSVFRQAQDAPSIQILEFHNVFPNATVFSSIGVSAYSSILGRVAEVTLPVNDGLAHADKLLANALFSMIQQKMTIGWGLALSGLDSVAPEFAEASGKSALYFTHPFGFPPEFSKASNGVEVGYMYSGILISRAEFDFFCDRGATEFELLLQSKKVDPLQWDRGSCI